MPADKFSVKLGLGNLNLLLLPFYFLLIFYIYLQIFPIQVSFVDNVPTNQHKTKFKAFLCLLSESFTELSFCSLSTSTISVVFDFEARL